METVFGSSDWELTVQRGEGEICILRAASRSARAVLPDELFGLPVTALGDRALVPDAKPVEGETVLVTGGAAEGEYNNRRITDLTLPRHLRSVGEYAFMNCSSLKTLRLYDSVEALGATDFMNCRAFDTVCLTRVGAEQGPVLFSIVSHLTRELDVTVTEQNGDTVRLIFPEYAELYAEIGSTYFFNYNIEGAGLPYHSVFQSRRLHIGDYDALWKSFLGTEHEDDTALRLAWWRLRYPAALSGEAESAYKDYLVKHMGELLPFILRQRDAAGLALALKALSPAAAELDAARALASELRFTEGTALLLERLNSAQKRGRGRSFEL